MKKLFISMVLGTLVLTSCPTPAPARATATTATTATRTMSTTSSMRSSSMSSSRTTMPRSYARNNSYNYGATNMLITGAVLYTVLSSESSDASEEEKEAVINQYESCVSDTGYEGSKSDVATLLKTDSGLSPTEKEMKACMLPDDSSIGILPIFGTIAIIGLGMLILGIAGALL